MNSAASFMVEGASFRDPSGFVFVHEGTIYRQVQTAYQGEYDHLMRSGLYESLTREGLLVQHDEVDLANSVSPGRYVVLRPDPIPFISYPYEWCFSQLQDAAMLTLRIQKTALEFGMSLKDASAYNVQFLGGRPIFIDTLSFESNEEGRPWAAYRQFCQHFLAPLALMCHTDIRLSTLLRTYLDGIPLDLAGSLLPGITKLQPGLLTHIHVHGAAQKRYANEPVASSSASPARPAKSGPKMGKTALLGLIDSLETTIRKLSWKPYGTTWADYYANNNYSGPAMESKRRIVADMLDGIQPAPRTAWDLGANTGLFSRLASERGAQTVAWDIDPAAVEKNYLDCRTSGESDLLPLLQDLTNPSPDLGWALLERKSLVNRGPADVVMALALVHHLAIGNNVPLGRIAAFFRQLGEQLIIEFVPKSDSQVQRLLASREDIFPGYTQEGFEQEFAACFGISRKINVPDSERTLYLMHGLPDLPRAEAEPSSNSWPIESTKAFAAPRH
jgi:hypothetical protein